jgi:hypothetical protein
VALPEIIGWDLDEFERAPMVEAAGPGAVIAIDYLQLLDHADGNASAAHVLRNLAHDRGWRLFLGVMATRQLAELSTEVSAKRAARVTATRLGAVVDGTNCTVILTGTDTRRRRITVSNGSIVRGSQSLHGIPNI